MLIVHMQLLPYKCPCSRCGGFTPEGALECQEVVYYVGVEIENIVLMSDALCAKCLVKYGFNILCKEEA